MPPKKDDKKGKKGAGPAPPKEIDVNNYVRKVSFLEYFEFSCRSLNTCLLSRMYLYHLLYQKSKWKQRNR